MPSSATTGIAFAVARGSMPRNDASPSIVSAPGVETSSGGASGGNSGCEMRLRAISTFAA